MQVLCKPSVKVVLDVRTEKEGGVFPVKVRVTFLGEKNGKMVLCRQRYYPVGIDLSERDWKKVWGSGNLSDELRKVRVKLMEFERKAHEIIDGVEFITEGEFEKLYTRKGKLQSVYDLFDERIRELEEEQRWGTRDSVVAAKRSFQRVMGEVTFGEITGEWLKKYEEKMLADGKSVNTVGMHLRALRAVVNRARKMRLIGKEVYGFEDYTVPSGDANKRALSDAEKSTLLGWKSNDKWSQRAVDMWKMSYYCFGLNVVDVANLRFRDIQDGVIRVVRQKSRRTNRRQKLLEIPVRQEVQEIIGRWGNKSLDPDEYVFPIFSRGMTEKQKHERIRSFAKRISKRIKGIVPKATIYSARHTFANTALNAGASTEMIQEALGHSSVRVTEGYLKGFSIESKRKIADKL